MRARVFYVVRLSHWVSGSRYFEASCHLCLGNAYQASKGHISKHLNPHQHQCENLISHNPTCYYFMLIILDETTAQIQTVEDTENSQLLTITDASYVKQRLSLHVGASCKVNILSLIVPAAKIFMKLVLYHHHNHHHHIYIHIYSPSIDPYRYGIIWKLDKPSSVLKFKQIYNTGSVGGGLIPGKHFSDGFTPLCFIQ
jgi:hypothetical protein